MQTNFNSDELDLIQNKSWFELKASASAKSISLLHEIDRRLRLEHQLLCLENGHASKFTKGENLNGFPYFVLDTPKLNSNESIFSIRIIIWWGNFISVNLLMGEKVYDLYREKIIANIGLMQSSALFINFAEDLWQHDLYDEKIYLKSESITKRILNDLKAFKISVVHSLNSGNIIQEILGSVELLNKVLS